MKKFLYIALLIAVSAQSINAYSQKGALAQAVSAYNVDRVRQILDEGLVTKQEIQDALAAIAGIDIARSPVGYEINKIRQDLHKALFAYEGPLAQAISAYNVNRVKQILDEGLATKQEIQDALAALAGINTARSAAGFEIDKIRELLRTALEEIYN